MASLLKYRASTIPPITDLIKLNQILKIKRAIDKKKPQKKCAASGTPLVKTADACNERRKSSYN